MCCIFFLSMWLVREILIFFFFLKGRKTQFLFRWKNKHSQMLIEKETIKCVSESIFYIYLLLSLSSFSFSSFLSFHHYIYIIIVVIIIITFKIISIIVILFRKLTVNRWFYSRERIERLMNKCKMSKHRRTNKKHLIRSLCCFENNFNESLLFK